MRVSVPLVFQGILDNVFGCTICLSQTIICVAAGASFQVLLSMARGRMSVAVKGPLWFASFMVIGLHKPVL